VGRLAGRAAPVAGHETAGSARPKLARWVRCEPDVFENPRHDYPKRIVYELSAEGGLRASIGFTKGGTPRRFEFTRDEAARRAAGGWKNP